VSKIVLSEVFIAECAHHLVPTGGVSQYRRGDAAAARSGKEARVPGAVGRCDTPLDEIANLHDHRDAPRALPLRGLVDQPARSRSSLAPNGPGPLAGVNIAYAASGNLADPRASARREDDDVGPSPIVAGRPVNQRGRKACQCRPVRQRELTRIVELVFGLVVLTLPIVAPITQTGVARQRR
jgi:hypothetical protein